MSRFTFASVRSFVLALLVLFAALPGIVLADGGGTVGEQADTITTEAAIEAVNTFEGRINRGDYRFFDMTGTDFLMKVFGTEDIEQAKAYYEGSANEMFVHTADNVLVYEDGSVSIDIVWEGLFGPYLMNAQRWYSPSVEVTVFDRLEWISLNVPDGRTSIEVQLTLTDQGIEFTADGPVSADVIVFNTVNEGSVMYAPIIFFGSAMTPEGMRGGIVLYPGQTIEAGFIYLEPGEYFVQIFSFELINGQDTYTMLDGFNANFTVQTAQ